MRLAESATARALGPVLLLAWLCLSPGLARAGGPTWNAPASCPTQARFAKKLAANKLGSGLALSFQVREKPGGYQMQVRDDGVVTHTINAEQCKALLDAALMILRLGRKDAQSDATRENQRRSRDPGPPRKTTDPAREQASGKRPSGRGGSADARQSSDEPEVDAKQESEREETVAIATTAQSDQENDTSGDEDRLAASDALVDVGPPKKNARRTKAKRPRRVRVRKTRRWPVGLNFVAQGFAGASLGVLPSIHGQGAVELGFGWSRWQVLAGPAIRFAAESPSSVGEDWRSDFWVPEGKIMGCYVLGSSRWRWPLCVGASLGVLDASRGSDAPGPTRVQVLWWSVLASIEARYQLSSRFYALARLQFDGLPNRPRVEIEQGPHLCCGAVGAGASLGIGLRLGRGE